MPEPLESSVVRIYSTNGKVVGSGFLVSQKLILTCAHVVADALGIVRKTSEMPDAIISLDFPLLAAKKLLKAKVVFWRPVNPEELIEDIAGLELESSPPELVKPIALIASENLWGHSFRVLGFPEGQPNGVWASGELRARTANGWVHLEDVKQPGYRLEAGFSGAPVWDEELQGIAGMAVAAEVKRLDAKAAFMIPTKVLREAWSELDEGATTPIVEQLELPEGTVPLDSPFYVERPPIESDCYRAIVKPGALISIKAPQQMGKQSLVGRILHHAQQHNYVTVSLNFQLAEQKVLADLDQFLRWFCAIISRRLRLPIKLGNYWDEIYGSKDNCTAYFEEYLLPQIPNPLVLVLDEVDCLFQHPEIAADFFSLLRAWHEEANNQSIWQKLRLVLVHSTEVYIQLNDYQSPFNAGLPIKLPEFKPKQVLDLAINHGLNWSYAQVERLMEMVGGHPYLVRVALYEIARGNTTLDKLLQTAPTEAGLYSQHLLRHLGYLEKHPELKAATKKVVNSSSAVRLEAIQAFKLHSMGLVHLQGNDVKPRCNLYRKYFSDRLRVS